MPESLTDRYVKDKKEFRKKGALDIILDVDTDVFMDPALLSRCEVEEFEKAKSKVDKYFAEIMALLTLSRRQGDAYWNQADRMLTFKELGGTCIGYTQYGIKGNAIGEILRKRTLLTIRQLIRKGGKESALIELLGIFQNDIGRDRISDLLIHILEPEIRKFTKRVMKELGLPKITVKNAVQGAGNRRRQIKRVPVLLLPASTLCPEPTAYEFYDIDRICGTDEKAWRIVEKETGKGSGEQLRKAEINELIVKDTDFRNALITAYKSANPVPYDFDKDPAGVYTWYRTSKDYTNRHPLKLGLPAKPTNTEIRDAVDKICWHFKKLVEDYHLWEFLYGEGLKSRRERAVKLLFFGIADVYCSANRIVLSRVLSGARNYLEFKVSRRLKTRVLVDVKLTSNGRLTGGLKKQIPIDMKQRNVYQSIHLVVDNGHPKVAQRFADWFDSQPKRVRSKFSYMIVDGTKPKPAGTAS